LSFRPDDKRQEELAAGDNVNDYINIFLQTNPLENIDHNIDQLLGMQHGAGAESAVSFPEQQGGSMTLPVKVKIEDAKVRFPFWIHVCVLVSLKKKRVAGQTH